MLSRRRRTILVARRPALAEPREVAPVMRALVSFPCHLTVRRALGSSRILRPGCLPALCVCTSALQYLTSPRPGACGRADVGLGNVCLPGPVSRSDSPGALATAAGYESGARLIMGSDTRIASFATPAVVPEPLPRPSLDPHCRSLPNPP